MTIDPNEIQLDHRKKVGIATLLATIAPESVHQQRAIHLVGGILLEQARIMDTDPDDEYGICIWDADQQEFEFELCGRQWRVKIEEVG